MGLFNFKKDKRFFTEEAFYIDFNEEAEKALVLYERMTDNGFKETAIAVFDVDFVSDKKEKLQALKEFLEVNYSYTFTAVKKHESNWLLNGETLPLSFDEDGLLFWAIDLYTKGFEFDCVLTGYGSLTDENNLAFPDLAQNTSQYHYEKGLELISKRNYSHAIIELTTSVRVDPENKEAWSARGYCKEELQIPKLGREDYDKALQIDPHFVEALLYKATNLDNAGEYESALQEYNKVTALEPENHLAFFNRGNTKFNLNDKAGACKDWAKAKELGSEYAQERLDSDCRQ